MSAARTTRTSATHSTTTEEEPTMTATEPTTATAEPTETATGEEPTQPTLPFDLPTDPHYDHSDAALAVADRVWVRYQRVMRPGTITALPDSKDRVQVALDYPISNEVRVARSMVYGTGAKSGTLDI